MLGARMNHTTEMKYREIFPSIMLKDVVQYILTRVLAVDHVLGHAVLQ